MPKIRWRKREAGAYYSDPVRWLIEKHGNLWFMLDLHSGRLNIMDGWIASTLRDAKLYIDDFIIRESCKHESFSWHGSRAECQECGEITYIETDVVSAYPPELLNGETECL